MARVERDTFGEQELTRVFMTPSLKEALRVEALLTASGVNYMVSVEPCGTTLFGSPRNGAAFYVSAGQAAYCRTQLTAADMELGVLMAENVEPEE
jgi:hypothetical protein